MAVISFVLLLPEFLFLSLLHLCSIYIIHGGSRAISFNSVNRIISFPQIFGAADSKLVPLVRWLHFERSVFLSTKNENILNVFEPFAPAIIVDSFGESAQKFSKCK